MTETEIRQIVENQRTYFYTGATLPLSHRIEALKKIQSYILTHEAEIGKAIRKDLGKSDFELYVRNRSCTKRDYVHAETHPLFCKREERPHTTGTISLQKF